MSCTVPLNFVLQVFLYTVCTIIRLKSCIIGDHDTTCSIHRRFVHNRAGDVHMRPWCHEGRQPTVTRRNANVDKPTTRPSLAWLLVNNVTIIIIILLYYNSNEWERSGYLRDRRVGRCRGTWPALPPARVAVGRSRRCVLKRAWYM